MILGHAAGVAAALAARASSPVQKVDVPALQRILREEGAVFEYSPDDYQRALTAIRRRFAAPPRTGPSPWGRPAKKD